jgi:serpin B
VINNQYEQGRFFNSILYVPIKCSSTDLLTMCLTLLLLLSVALSNQARSQDFTSANNKFAASVYQRLATKSGNFLVSPLSAELILALSQSGARNDTAEEIQDSLSLPRESEQIEDAVQAVLSALGPEQDYVLRIINKIYVKEDYPIREEFSAIAQDVYDAQVENIDFCNKSEAARTMNQWVEEETEDKIQDLVDPDILGNETRAVLINALRFRANWTTPFQFFATFRQDFYPADGDSVEVETMHIQDEYLEYYENPELNASFVVLPIQGYNISMTVALPDARTGLALLEEHISQVMEIPEETSIEMLNVALPKFKIQSKIDFKEILQSLGVKKAFEDGEADFSGIAGEKGELFINDVVQKTYIDVNEDGVEAAAATYIGEYF